MRSVFPGLSSVPNGVGITTPGADRGAELVFRTASERWARPRRRATINTTIEPLRRLSLPGVLLIGLQCLAGCNDTAEPEAGAAGGLDAADAVETSDSAAGPAGDAPDGGTASDVMVSEETAGEPVGDTWDSFASGFFTSYCTRCHSSGASGSRVDLTGYEGVVTFAATIRCGVSPVQLDDCPVTGQPYRPRFPIGNGPFPTDDERAQLVAWIDAGLPQ